MHTYIYKNIGLGLGQSWDRTQKTTGASIYVSLNYYDFPFLVFHKKENWSIVNSARAVYSQKFFLVPVVVISDTWQLVLLVDVVDLDLREVETLQLLRVKVLEHTHLLRTENAKTIDHE